MGELRVNDLREQFEVAVASRKLLPRGTRLLVAVSGGVDSMVLLQLLHGLAPKFRWQLNVAHFNHQLRGRASDGDEQLVGDATKSLGLRFVAGRANVRSAAKRKGISIEMAARELRHTFLARTAQRLQCRAVALAHHADDQVELFFLRLLRGSGLDGIAGMKWRSPSPVEPRVQLVRPLLGFSKSDLVSFARKHRIAFRQDESNLTSDPLRNRVRLELLPLLRRRFQPAVDRTVLRLMEIAGAESEVVTALAQVGPPRRSGNFAWGRWPVALQRREIQRQLLERGFPPDFDLIEALRKQPGRWVTMNPQRALSVTPDGRVRMRAVAPLKFERRRLRLLLDRAGQVEFDGLKLRWRIARKHEARITRQPGTECFDADQVGDVIKLRHWQPGDRFQPIGMPTALKLQDWFVNQKIPAERRRRLVLATTARGEIFWIEGLRIGERFKLTAQTRRQLHWSWARELPDCGASGNMLRLRRLKDHG